METIEDETLMLQARDGDVDRLSVLFERYSGLLYTYFMKRCQRHDLSEDLTQEVFVKVLKYRESFKPGRGFRGWLFTIARNVLNSQLTRKSDSIQVLDSDLESDVPREPVEERDSPDVEAIRSQETDLLYEALERLSDEKRQLVIMRRIQDLSYAEMVEILGHDVKTLKMRAHRAVRELAVHLKSIMKEKSYEMR